MFRHTAIIVSLKLMNIRSNHVPIYSKKFNLISINFNLRGCNKYLMKFGSSIVYRAFNLRLESKSKN
jgi:hypothetical protein